MPYDYEDTGGSGSAGPLSPWEQYFAEERLQRLNADPIRFDHGDPQAAQYVDDQWQRTYANGDRPQRVEFDRFTPSTDASDLALMAPVGKGGANSPMDVYKAKKVLHNAGAHEFRPGDEGFGEANPRFANDIARFQRAEELKVDGRIDPGGPTLHALAARAPSLAGARPPMLDAADFQDRTGRDPNKTLTGRRSSRRAARSHPTRRRSRRSEAMRRGRAPDSSDARPGSLLARPLLPVVGGAAWVWATWSMRSLWSKQDDAKKKGAPKEGLTRDWELRCGRSNLIWSTHPRPSTVISSQPALRLGQSLGYCQC
jgi:hypothetical protein